MAYEQHRHEGYKFWGFAGQPNDRMVEMYNQQDPWHPSRPREIGRATRGGASREEISKNCQDPEPDINKWGYPRIIYGIKGGFHQVEKNMWKLREETKKEPIFKEKPSTSDSQVVDIWISLEIWKDFVSLLWSRAFFMKWGGGWLAFSRIHKWVEEEWGNHFTLKALPNGFFLVIEVGSCSMDPFWWEV